jgi:hypothetical protein
MQAGFVNHNCEPLGRSILIPIKVENYNSKLVAEAKCLVCNRNEFEAKLVDKSVAPSKGFYMTV